MAKKKFKTDPFPLRLRRDIKRQLERLAEKNASSISAEIVTGVRKHLEANGLWPIPADQLAELEADDDVAESADE